MPVTPGAVGVTEVAYIGILSSVAGSGMTEQLTAAVMLFRIAQWFMPIPIGWVLLIVMRRGHWGELLRGPHVAPVRAPQSIQVASRAAPASLESNGARVDWRP